jgi:hypothetical protein
MRQFASLYLVVQSIESGNRKRYAAAAAILLLHLLALRVLMHVHTLRGQGEQKESKQIAVYFPPLSLPQVNDAQKNSLHEPAHSSITPPLVQRTNKVNPAAQVAVPSTSIMVIPATIEPPSENAEPKESLVERSLKSIAKIDKEIRAEDDVARGSATMWTQDRFGQAISSAARDRDSKSETYVTNDGRVVTRFSGIGGATCVSRAGDAVPDGIDHMQSGEKLQVVSCH